MHHIPVVIDFLLCMLFCNDFANAAEGWSHCRPGRHKTPWKKVKYVPCTYYYNFACNNKVIERYVVIRIPEWQIMSNHVAKVINL